MVAIVVVAGHLDRAGESLEAKFLPARLGDLQRLETAPHIFAGDVLLAGDLLRVADRLGDQHGVENAAVVEVLADFVLLRLPFALVHDMFHDILDGRIVRADLMQVQAEIALGLGAGRPSVILRA